MKSADPLAGFKLKGVPLQLATEPAAVKRLRAKLDAMKVGELVRTRDAATLAELSYERLFYYATDPGLQLYRCMVPTRMLVWGNPKTIKELKRRLTGR